MGCENSTEVQDRRRVESERDELHRQVQRLTAEKDRAEAETTKLRGERAQTRIATIQANQSCEIKERRGEPILTKMNAFSVDRLTELAELLECPVCMECYNDDTRVPVTFKCGHSTCISHVPMLRGKCPKCRQSIPSDPSTIFPAYALKAASATLASMHAAAERAEEEQREAAAKRAANQRQFSEAESEFHDDPHPHPPPDSELLSPDDLTMGAMRAFSEILLEFPHSRGGGQQPTAGGGGGGGGGSRSTNGDSPPPPLIASPSDRNDPVGMFVTRLNVLGGHNAHHTRQSLADQPCEKCSVAGCIRDALGTICCCCDDERPMLPQGSYPVYRSGTGWVADGMRNEGYCIHCKTR